MMNILETIKMLNEIKKITLSDLVDINFLQELQDNFAEAMGVGSLTVDDNGPITKPSNFSDFCTNYIMASKLGSKKCNECDIECGKLAMEKGEAVIYNCHAGLTHFVVPIIVAGKHIASILGGQISLTTLDEEHFKNVAKELGITSDKKYLDALKKIEIVSEEKIKTATKLLFMVANSISQIAHKNYDLINKNARESLTGKIVEKIRSTLDSEEIKKYFIEITRKYFDADRCLFVDYDKKTGMFLTFKLEKLKSNGINSLIGIETESVFPEFCAKLKRGKSVIVRDLEKTLSRKNLLGYKATNTLRDSEVKSDYGLVVKCRDEIVGILIIHFINEKKVLTHDEFDFLKTLRDHAGTALCQAYLYSETKQQAEREVLLRNVTNAIRNSLDIDVTKKQIVDIIGKTLKADRCFILEYNKENDKILIVNEEYLSSNDIISYKGVDLNEHIPSLVAEFKKGKCLIINESGSTLDGKRVDFEHDDFGDVKSAIEKYNVNSALVFPLFYAREFLGDLVLHYVEKQHDIGNEEINFLNLIANQIALAFHQAKLYEKIQLQSERERISRNIIEILRSTMDKTIIKNLFVKNIGKYFNADRVYFSEFDTNANKYIPVEEKAEYLSNPNEKSFVEYDLSGSIMSGHIQPLVEKREIIIPNWKRYIEKTSKDAAFITLYENANVQSSYGFPVLYEGRIMGYFCIEFTHKINELLDEDINRIRNICTQAGIALYHAELYFKTQEAWKSRRELIARVKSGIQEPVNNIIKTSKVLSELGLEHEKQLEYLNNIINSCNQLLELTKDISDTTELLT